MHVNTSLDIKSVETYPHLMKNLQQHFNTAAHLSTQKKQKKKWALVTGRNSYWSTKKKNPGLDCVWAKCHKTRDEAVILWGRIWLTCYHLRLLFLLGTTGVGSNTACGSFFRKKNLSCNSVCVRFFSVCTSVSVRRDFGALFSFYSLSVLSLFLRVLLVSLFCYSFFITKKLKKLTLSCRRSPSRIPFCRFRQCQVLMEFSFQLSFERKMSRTVRPESAMVAPRSIESHRR